MSEGIVDAESCTLCSIETWSGQKRLSVSDAEPPRRRIGRSSAGTDRLDRRTTLGRRVSRRSFVAG